jgi:hypothetical protein
MGFGVGLTHGFLTHIFRTHRSLTHRSLMCRRFLIYGHSPRIRLTRRRLHGRPQTFLAQYPLQTFIAR